MARKAGLGRGLESLLGEAAGEVQDDSGGVDEIPLGRVHVNPDQPRKVFDEHELEELADSIRQNGVLQPILVRPASDGYQIVAGERRYQAARLAGLKTIPAIVRELDDDKVLLLALIENLQRSDLNPMEEARGYRRLMEANGLSQRQLAEALSKSRSAVANTLRLTELPEEVQDLVSEGKLSAGHARAILSVPDHDGRIRLAKRVVEEGLSVRQTEKLAPLVFGSDKKEQVRVRATTTPESYKRAASELKRALGTQVAVRSVRGKNKIEIEFVDEEQLETLVEQLRSAGGGASSEGVEGTWAS